MDLQNFDMYPLKTRPHP